MAFILSGEHGPDCVPIGGFFLHGFRVPPMAGRVEKITAINMNAACKSKQRAGAIIREPAMSGGGDDYILTDAGRDLKSVLSSIGEWGQKWARDIDEDDLDPGWLVWAMHRRFNADAMPSGRTVLEMEFTDAPKDQRFFWFVCTDGDVEVCVRPTGFEVDLKVITKVQYFGEVWRGIRELRPEIAAGRIQLEGKAALKRDFPKWLLFSIFAKTKRQK